MLRRGALVALLILGALASPAAARLQVTVSQPDPFVRFLNPSPSSVDFGGVPVGTASSSHTVFFTNNNRGTRDASAASVSGSNAGDFGIVDDGCAGAVLATGDSCAVTLQFGPLNLGKETATLDVQDSFDSSPTDNTVPLQGTGTVHMTVSPGSLAFTQQVGTTSPAQTITLSDDQQAAQVSISSISLTGANPGDYGLTTTCGSTLSQGSPCTISITFKPTASGSRPASVTITSNSTSSPDVVALSGTGTTPGGGTPPGGGGTPPGGGGGGTTTAPSTSGPALSLNVGALAFGPRIVQGGTDPLTVKLTNGGDQPLIVSGLAITGPNAGDFALGSNTCTTVAPGASCTIDVLFMPGATGDRAAALVITDNASGSPHLVALTGSGLPPPVLFTTANAEPVSGNVLVALPAGASSRALGPSVKGRKFIPLRQARQLPVGSIFDTRRGTVRVATATLTKGVAQTGTFFAGFFQLLQRRSQRSLTDMQLSGGSFACAASAPKIGKSKGRAQIARKKKPKLSSKVIRQLQSDVHGKFRTSGKYAAATVRGTAWTMRDRCDGTLTRVKRGTVVVTNLRTQKQVAVKAGKSLLVRKP